MITTLLSKRAQALEILGLPPEADREAVRQAFRRQALACHPDLHPGRPELERRFKRMAEAYRLALEENSSPGGSLDFPRRGRDLFFRLTLSFLQAALGGEVALRYPKPHHCPRCAGRAPGCTRCGGRGEAESPARLRVRVPAGVEDREVLRIRWAGGIGAPGGEPGGLYLSVSVRPHPLLRRRGLDIHSEVEVPRARLWEGGTIQVNTLRGVRQIFLLPFTPEGKIIQLRGQGIFRERGGITEAGDHFARLAVPASEAAAPSAPQRG
ncbi:MAG: DnaJ C-terminal domain-containing protein [Nitrospinota bacterium]